MPVRRRWPSRLGVLGLLASPLALTLASSSTARAEDALHDDDSCRAGGGIVLYVDDEPAPRCASLLGDADVRASNELWRSERIMAVESGGRTLDVVHTDAQLRRPEVRTLSGMAVSEIHRAQVVEEPCDDEELSMTDAGPGGDAGELVYDEPVFERVARVELSEPWAELCGQDSLFLRVDDALGARGRVLHIDRRGVLAHLGGRLVWLSRSGSAAPVFRTTWRSGFSVVTDADLKPSPSKKKRRPKRRSRRRR